MYQNPAASWRADLIRCVACRKVLSASKPEWRNWQTRQVEGLVPVMGVQVQVLSPAFATKGLRAIRAESFLFSEGCFLVSKWCQHCLFDRTAHTMPVKGHVPPSRWTIKTNTETATPEHSGPTEYSAG